MPRQAAGLTAVEVAKAGPGSYVDGRGLRLLVKPTGARFWVFRWTVAGKTRETGLGAAGHKPGLVSLAEARKRAGELHRMVKDGRDPLAEKAAAEAEEAAQSQRAAIRGKTFDEVARLYIANNRAGWRNAKHAAQWASTLDTYAAPVLGKLPASEVGTGHVTDVLNPIWSTKPETASRVRGRIEAVLDFARVSGWREGENPARWRGHLDHILPAPSKVRAVEHHAALPWKEVGAFMAALAGQKGMAALALQFAILTAARTGEVLGARWGEVDRAGKVWIVPAARMKAGRDHRVPLAPATVALLDTLAALNPAADPLAPVFPSAGKPLSNMALLMLLRRMKRPDLTVHGFRSTFRDWVAEATRHSADVAEAALAHTVGNKVRLSYERGDKLDMRRALMDDWAAFCAKPYAEPAGNVVELRRA